MKNNVKSVLLLMLAFTAFSAGLHAQQDLDHKAPTVEIGLDGMSFSKGSIGAKVVMDMVARKQRELVVLGTQNYFLAHVKDAGGTVYSYTNNVVKELVYEKDEKVRSKKIMAQTINLVFVVAYLDFYLKHLDTVSFRKFDKLARIYGDTLMQGQVSINSLHRKLRESKEDNYCDAEATKFIALLIDMCSEAVQEDSKLKQLGLIQLAFSPSYEYMNLYKDLHTIECTNEIVGSKDKVPCNTTRAVAEEVFSDMKARLAQYTNYIGVVNYLVEEFRFRSDNADSKENSRVTPATDLVDTLKKEISFIVKALSDRKTTDIKLMEELNNLTKMYSYLEKAKRQIKEKGENDKILSDVLYTIYSEFIPLLKAQSYRSESYLVIISELNDLAISLSNNIISRQTHFRNVGDELGGFLLIAAKLYEFDKATTISEYLKLLEGVGDIFPNDKITYAVKTITSFVKDYSEIKKLENGKEVLCFNVESFIFKLQSIKPKELTRLKFSFTVGVNNVSFDQPILLPDASNTTRTLSFVSEKIGVKYNIRDWGFWRPRSPGETYVINGRPYVKTAPPKEPIVSSLFISMYGSGLLYNIVNTKTEKEFNFPLLGLGFGATFTNSLDFSIGIGMPIRPDRQFGKAFSEAFDVMRDADYWRGNLRNISFGNCYYSVGFDVQFGEYYRELMDRRDANKLQKAQNEDVK